MALLPARNILDGSALPVTSQMKTALGSLRDYCSDLLGTDSSNKAAARTALGAAASGVNADITNLTSLTALPAALTPIGSGQTWQNMTASRNLVSSYTNSSGRPIAISVRVVNAAAGNFSVSISVGGVVVGESFQYTPNDAGNNNFTLFSIVPNGAVYGVASFANCTLQLWAELR